MLYFIKDNRLHKFPVPKRCQVIREKQILRDTIPHDVDLCSDCMGYWPNEKKNED